MKRTLICILLAWAFTVHAQEDVVSFTEGVITSDFVSEATMKQDLLQMLDAADEFTTMQIVFKK
jgi:hypothetical protein